MIKHDATVPERANSVGKGDFIVYLFQCFAMPNTNTVFSFSFCLFILILFYSFTYSPATCKLFRQPICIGLQSERAKQQDAAIATATAEVAKVAEDEELASYAGLVGKRIYDADDDVAAQIVSIDTASSRGQKYEEIRATCVELINGAVPGCAISLMGKVSLLCHVHFRTLTLALTLTQLVYFLFFYLSTYSHLCSSHCCTG